MMRFIPTVLIVFATILPTNAQEPVTAQAPEQNYTLTPQDQPFVGHYYLSGVMETGSELLLRADGRYQWFLSVGSMDQTSEGIWSVRNGKIVLLADPVSKAPLLTLGKLEPWGIEPERVVREDTIIAANALILEKCRFLSDDNEDPATDNAISPPYQDVTPELLAKAQAADDAEYRLRSEYEAAAIAAMLPHAAQPDADSFARHKRIAWRTAWNHRRQTESDAKRPFQRLPEPKLPQECDLRVSSGDVDPDNKTNWINGFAVQLTDPTSGAAFNRVPVALFYSDGTISQHITHGAGIAWVNSANNPKVVSVMIDMSEHSGVPAQTFSFAPVSSGYLTIAVNVAYATERAFDVMQLTVEGTDLVAFEGRGRYERAP